MARLTVEQEQAMNELVVTANRAGVGDKVDADSTKLHTYCISNPWMDGAVFFFCVKGIIWE